MASKLLCVTHGCFSTQQLKRSHNTFPPHLSRTTAPNSKLFKVRIRCSTGQTSTNITTSTSDRLSANYQPTSWSYDYLQSLNVTHHVESYKEKMEKLEKEVKRIFSKEEEDGNGVLAQLELIDDIQRLGLGYRFEDDIRKALDRISSLEGFSSGLNDRSLHATALSFRLLRQNGYSHKVTQDIFNSFKDGNGTFKASITKDVKGMLSLYEASHLGFEGENLLDEARAFTRMHLNDLIKRPDIIKCEHLARQVSHALELPLHHRMSRLEARSYTESYSKKPDANPLLLEVAKWDFNMVQSTYKIDLKDVSSWWKDMALASKLSFARDRLVETYFWTIGMVYEPQYSNVRKEVTKVFKLVTVIDDVYDVYGTVEELELFTDAVERWDVKAVEILPDYMKICFLALYNTVNDVVYDTLKKHEVYILPYLAKAWADMCKAFLQEKKWNQNKETPKFKDYIENGWVSSSGALLLSYTYFLISKNITKEGLEFFENNYLNLVRSPSTIFRLTNDLGTSTEEIEIGETSSSVLCIMRDNGLSEESARQFIRNLIQKNWKVMNEEILSNSDYSLFSKPFVEAAVNLARIAQCQYQHGDGHGRPDSRSKNRIVSLIIDPIK